MSLNTTPPTTYCPKCSSLYRAAVRNRLFYTPCADHVATRPASVTTCGVMCGACADTGRTAMGVACSCRDLDDDSAHDDPDYGNDSGND